MRKSESRVDVYRTESGKLVKTGGGVVITHNLDRNIDGERGFCKNPKSGNMIHLGLTKPRHGSCYDLFFVLIKEELLPGLPRTCSRRIAYTVTDTEALDWIILSGNFEELLKAKFRPLIKLLPGQTIAGLDDWTPTAKESDILWNQTEFNETERRKKHVSNSRTFGRKSSRI